MLREPLAGKRHQFSRHMALRSVEEMRAGWREPRRRPSVVPVRATAVAVRGRAGSGLLRPLLWALLVVAIVVALIALLGGIRETVLMTSPEVQRAQVQTRVAEEQHRTAELQRETVTIRAQRNAEAPWEPVIKSKPEDWFRHHSGNRVRNPQRHRAGREPQPLRVGFCPGHRLQSGAGRVEPSRDLERRSTA
jgi:uncharacterized membrane protein